MTAGQELRRARALADLSLEELAQRSSIQRAKIEALEEGAYERLPSGRYLDGIVRSCARALGLDEGALVARVQTERTAFDELPLSDESSDTFLSETGEPENAPSSSATIETPAPLVADDPFEHRSPARSRASGAWAAIALAALAVTGWGLYLYDAGASLESPAAASLEAPAGDTRLEHEPGDVAATSSAPATAGVLVDDTPPVVIPPGGVAATEPPPPAPADDAALTTPPVRAPGERTEHNGSAAAAVPDAAPDLTGTWTLATAVERSSYRKYEGLRLAYRLELQHEGDRITGVGRKISENGHPLTTAGQTPIRLVGTLDGDRLTLTFTEEGHRRVSSGTLTLQVDGSGLLRGRFASDAARSLGSAEARRAEL